MPEPATIERPPKPAPDWELVLKRNPVERLKREKAPLGIRDELPALIAAGYEAVAEEDVVRLQWWGLYHDKPKVGTFMLRIKLPGGRLTPAQLAELLVRFGDPHQRTGQGSRSRIAHKPTLRGGNTRKPRTGTLDRSSCSVDRSPTVRRVPAGTRRLADTPRFTDTGDT